MTLPSRNLNRKLKQRLDLHARQILLQIAVPLDGPLTVPASDEDHAVTVTVRPAGEVMKLDASIPGRFLSHVEQMIWDALAEKPLIGKQIAAKIGDEYDSTLKVILRNLIQRRVLKQCETGGYARATRNDFEGD